MTILRCAVARTPKNHAQRRFPTRVNVLPAAAITRGCFGLLATDTDRSESVNVLRGLSLPISSRVKVIPIHARVRSRANYSSETFHGDRSREKEILIRALHCKCSLCEVFGYTLYGYYGDSAERCIMFVSVIQ